MANSAFYYGVVRTLADSDRPVWTRMSFAAAEENFYSCARRGIDAKVYWPGFGEVQADELTLRHLLPMAEEGLKSWGVATEVRDRYLGVIEERCRTGQNGASWQNRLRERPGGQGNDRATALVEMLRLYLEKMHIGEPVHTWKLP